MTLTLANILTLSRLFLVPFFLAALVKGEMGWALAIFCIAGGTDLIDGTVARMFSSPSRWGAIVDPIADKCLVQSCFISLGVLLVLPWWFVAIALGRDIIIIAGILYLRHEKARLPYRPAMVSKIATLFQLALAILGLIYLWKPFLAPMGYNLSVWLLWTMYATVAFILLSGIKYVVMGLDILRHHRTSHA